MQFFLESYGKIPRKIRGAVRNRINTNKEREPKKRESMREKYVRYDSKKYPIGFNAKRRFQIKPI